MDYEITKLLAERYFKKDDINDWAVKCLEKGFDSPSLRILASMPESIYSGSEIDDYLKRALTELGWNKINSVEYLIEYAKILAKGIIENEVDIFNTASEICSIYVDLDRSPDLGDWAYIDEMIWEYNYSLETGNKSGYFYRPKDEIIYLIRKTAKEFLDSN